VNNIHTYTRFRNVIVAAAFLAGMVGISQAEMMIARDPSNPYQLNPHAKVKHVVFYDGGNGDWKASSLRFRGSVARMAVKYGFRLDTSSARGYVTTETLADVDVLVLGSSTGDKFHDRPASEAAAERFIYESGKSLFMHFGAISIIPCPGRGSWGGGDSLSAPTCRFLARAAARQLHTQSEGTRTVYVDSVRAGEIPPHASMGGTVPQPSHSISNHGISNVESRNIYTGLARTWQGINEVAWPHFTSSPRIVEDMVRKVASLDSVSYTESRVNVLLSLDESRDDVGSNRMGDHPVAWTRKMGNGLAAAVGFGYYDASDPRIVAGQTIRDSIVEKFNWRLLRYLARDFVGCMNPSSPHYNPEASVTALTLSDKADPCNGPIALQSGNVQTRLNLSVRSGVVNIHGADPGVRISIMDVAGKLMARRTGSGSGMLEIRGLKSGIYFVQVSAPDGSKTAQRINLF
jgi:hypothetical protein